MAAACKALPRCTRAYSAVIVHTLSYECVDLVKHAPSHALVNLHRPAGPGYRWRTDFCYAIPSRAPGAMLTCHFTL